MESDPSFRVEVKGLSGRVETVAASAKMTVADLKEKYQREFGVSREHQCLIFEGHHLRDGWLLSDYDIRDGSRLHLVLSLPGGAPGPSGSGRCMTGSNMLPRGRKTAVHTDKPDRNTLFPGLNMQGDCAECRGSSTARLGFVARMTGVSGLMAECRCPDCGTQIGPIHAVFLHCGYFEVRGCRSDDTEGGFEISGRVRGLDYWLLGEEKRPPGDLEPTFWDYFALAIRPDRAPIVPPEYR